MNCTDATCACSPTATDGAADAAAPAEAGAVTRRRVVATTVLGAVAATALAACGGGDDDATATTQPSAGETGSASAGGDATASATASSSSGSAVIAKLADVPVGGATSAQTADGTAIILSQPSAGKVVAFDARCPHQGCTVAPSGDKLRCPCHGSAFKTADGSLINGPATRGLTEVAVKVDGADVVAG
jgi:Rieske Fe-S protein